MTRMAWAHQPHAQLPSPKQQAAMLRVQNRCRSLALQELLDRPTVQPGPDCCPSEMEETTVTAVGLAQVC